MTILARRRARHTLAVIAATLSLIGGTTALAGSEPIGILDYSESGDAFTVRPRDDGRAFDLFARPGVSASEFEFAIRNAGNAGPITVIVHGAPRGVAPEYTEGEFRWRSVAEVSQVDGALRLRQTFESDHAVIRLAPPPPAPEGVEYYDLERLEDHLTSIDADPRVTVEVIGWSYQNRPDIDRPIYKVTISDATVPDDDKTPVLILSRQHGNEFASNHILEGAIDFILGDYQPGLRPDDLLERFRFTIYPMINPDGVEAGQWGERHNRNGIDLNREWNDSGSGPDEEWETRHVHADIEVLQAQSMFAQAVDLHGCWDCSFSGYRFCLDCRPSFVPLNYYSNQQTFFELQEDLNPWRRERDFRENGATIGMARYCLFEQFNIDIHTPETSDGVRTRSSLLDEGPLYVLSFYEYLLNVNLMNGVGERVEQFTLDNDRLFVTVNDLDENDQPGAIDRVTVTLRSETTGDIETLELEESSANSGFFQTGEGIALSSTPFDASRVEDGLLQAAPGDRIRVDYVDDDFAQSASWDFATAVGSGLVLEPVEPGRAGEINTLRAHGADPGERVAFAYSTSLDEASSIGACPELWTALASPTLVGVVPADGSGSATVSGFAPAAAAGVRIFSQAIALGSCAASNVNSTVFN
ncbi:MAG: M14 family zinc carboxypeptidase [Phycisphaerales bacterium]